VRGVEQSVPILVGLGQELRLNEKIEWERGCSSCLCGRKSHV